MRAMPKSTSLVTTRARRAPAPKRIQPDHLSDSGGSDPDVRHIAQIDELTKAPREAWVGGQSTCVRQKLTIRHYAPSVG